jgi:hypothetical protein
MSTVTLPSGAVPIRELTTDEVLVGNRTTSFRFDLFSSAESGKGTLLGVQSGSATYTANASIKSRGSLSIVDLGQSVDFLNDRVRPVAILEGYGEIPLGMFIFSSAPEAWSDTGRSWACQLLDKTAILDQWKIDAPFDLDAGAVITTEIADLIADAGEANIAITPSAATLVNPLLWEAGTSYLRIINDLLSVAGYFSLFTDGNGQFRAEKYVRPAARPIRYEFLDGEQAIYAPDFTKDVDLFSIPNTVIAISQGNGTDPALTSTATNTDANSPYSTVSRGRTIAVVEQGVEAADQTTLDNYSQRRLIELTSPTRWAV